MAAMGATQTIAATYGVIGAASIAGNATFCFLLYNKPFLLKKPHNILLLTLATADMLTGATIFATPLFRIIRIPHLAGPAGYFFCHFFGNNFLVFYFGKVSILIVLLLSLERWCSVIKPFKYKVLFSRKRLLLYILCIIVSSVLMHAFNIFRVKFENNTCETVKLGKKRQRALVLTNVTITFVLPALITWASFIHIMYRIKNTPSVSGITQHPRHQQKLLLRMCVITAAVLTGCWFPSQICFVLINFGITQVTDVGVKISLVLSMFNSTVNPWIYFLSNKEYRKYSLSLSFICKPTATVSPERTVLEVESHLDQANPLKIVQP